MSTVYLPFTSNLNSSWNCGVSFAILEEKLSGYAKKYEIYELMAVMFSKPYFNKTCNQYHVDMLNGLIHRWSDDFHNFPRYFSIKHIIDIMWTCWIFRLVHRVMPIHESITDNFTVYPGISFTSVASSRDTIVDEKEPDKARDKQSAQSSTRWRPWRNAYPVKT